jgi:hypothetical protein
LNAIYGATAVVALAMSVLSLVVTRKPRVPVLNLVQPATK